MTATASAPAGLTGMPSCPYIGLVPFTAEHQSLFFGRRRDVELIAANVEAFRLTLLFGPSGVGKSSILAAGVAPRLRDDAGDRRVLVISVSSWRDEPLGVIDTQARRAASAAGLLLAPSDARATLADRLRSWAAQIEGEVFCIFDQFEDYFLYHDDPDDDFGVELAKAMAARTDAAHFIVSLREDALGKLDRFQTYVPNLFDNRYRLEHLRSDQGREAILGPLQAFNDGAEPAHRFDIEPALVDEILRQVHTGEVTLGEAGEGRVADATARDEIETAHLQLVLTRLWAEEEQAGSRVLRLETLIRLGGAPSIVRSHLAACIARLPDDDQALAAEVFRHLVTPSGAKIAHNVDDLAEYAATTPARLAPVLERLSGGDVRILRGIPPAPDRPDSARYEIFHDALAPAILDWRRQRETATDREEAERKIAASRAQLRRERRRRARLVGLLGLTVALLAATVVLLVRSRNAEARQRSERLASQSLSVLDGDPLEATRIGLEAWDAAETDQAEDALRRASSRLLIERRVGSHAGTVNDVDVSADGTTVLTVSTDRTAVVWGPQGEVVLLSGHERPIWGGLLSADGALAVTWSEDRTVRTWDADTGDLLSRRDGYAGYQDDVALSHDGDLVASADASGTMVVWEARTGTVVAELAADDDQWMLAAHFSPVDPDVVFTGDTVGTLQAWSLPSGEELARTPATDLYTNVLTVSADGTTVGAGSGYGSFGAWRWQQDGAVLTGYQGSDAVTALDLSADGTTAVASAGKSTGLWYLEETEPANPFWQSRGQLVHDDFANRSVLAADGRFFVSVSRDGVGLVGDGQTGRLLTELRGHVGSITSVDLAGDGEIVTGSDDGTALLWRLGDSRALRGHTDWVIDVDASGDGRIAASSGVDGQVIVWDTATGEAIDTIDRIDDDSSYAESFFDFNPVAIDADGRFVAAGHEFGEVWVWDREAGTDRPVAELSAVAGSLAFEPGGRRLAVSTVDGQVVLWDWRDDQPAEVVAPGGGAAFAAWSPDGERLAAGLADGSIVVWDADSLEVEATMEGHIGPVWDVAFSPDGRLIASAGQDRTARIWDADGDDEPVTLVGHDVRLATVDFDREGDQVITGDAGGFIGIWDAATGRSLALARAHADSVNAVVSLDDGQILSASDDEALRIRTCDVCMPIDELVEQVRTRLTLVGNSTTGALPTTEQLSANDVGRGDCVADQPTDETFLRVLAVSCSEPHEVEIIGTFSFTAPVGTEYPGAVGVHAQAMARCSGDVFEDYVGVAADESRYELTTWAPPQESWDTGNRRFTCVLLTPEGRSTGSARGSGQ